MGWEASSILSSSNAAGPALTVDSACYRNIIIQLFVSKLQDNGFRRNLVPARRGLLAICHTDQEIIRLLLESSPGCKISRSGYLNWPLRSCELSSLYLGVASFIPTSPRTPTHWRMKLSIVSTKFSHIYAKWPWKISTECVCASKSLEVISRLFISVNFGTDLLFHLAKN